jgi:small subunit ribosomal protein S4
MARRTGAKTKICRRIGQSLWGDPKCPSVKRPYPAGEHGNKRRRKVSVYGELLQEKQKVREFYGVLEKQFRRTVERANRMRGVTAENLLILLERRLDAMIYRLGFAPTIFAARQFVTHGHILVDGKRVNIPSYTVAGGQKVEVAESFRENAVLQMSLDRSVELPPYLQRAADRLSGSMVRDPALNEVRIVANPVAVVEYYSR